MTIKTDTIGFRINQLRKSHRWTLRRLADESSVSHSYISDIEHDRKRPSLDRLKDIAAALDTNIAYLLGESLNPAPPSAGYITSANDWEFILREGDLSAADLQSLLSDFDDWEPAKKQTLLRFIIDLKAESASS